MRLSRTPSPEPHSPTAPEVAVENACVHALVLPVKGIGLKVRTTVELSTYLHNFQWTFSLQWGKCGVGAQTLLLQFGIIVFRLTRPRSYSRFNLVPLLLQ